LDMSIAPTLLGSDKSMGNLKPRSVNKYPTSLFYPARVATRSSSLLV
jgi:hypothetical protein